MLGDFLSRVGMKAGIFYPIIFLLIFEILEGVDFVTLVSVRGVHYLRSTKKKNTLGISASTLMFGSRGVRHPIPARPVYAVCRWREV